MKTFNGIRLHENGGLISGAVLEIANINIPLLNDTPVHLGDECIGKATIKKTDKYLTASIVFKDGVDRKNIGQTYAALTGRAQQVEDGKILIFTLDAISVSMNENEFKKTIFEFDREHSFKSEVGKTILQLRKKGWTERRIGRYMLSKFKIVLEK